MVCQLTLGSKCPEDMLWAWGILWDMYILSHMVWGRQHPQHRNNQLGKPNNRICCLLQLYFYMSQLGKELEE